jgi:hypothetical protein
MSGNKENKEKFGPVSSALSPLLAGACQGGAVEALASVGRWMTAVL